MSIKVSPLPHCKCDHNTPLRKSPQAPFPTQNKPQGARLGLEGVPATGPGASPTLSPSPVDPEYLGILAFLAFSYSLASAWKALSLG